MTFWPGKRLTLSFFNGRVLIHIREYVSMNGRHYPTKKSASFTPGRLSMLRSNIDDIDEALRQQEINASFMPPVTVEGGSLFKAHLGAGVYASVSGQYNGVSLRRHWKPVGMEEIVPTKNGIYLPAPQWSALKLKLDELLAAHPELHVAIACIYTHENQMGMYDCYECMPFSRGSQM